MPQIVGVKHAKIIISFVYVSYVNIADERNATIRLNVQLSITFW